MMSFPVNFITAVAVLIFTSAPLFAQSDAVAGKKAELLREILKEKRYAPLKGSGEEIKAAVKKQPQPTAG